MDEDELRYRTISFITITRISFQERTPFFSTTYWKIFVFFFLFFWEGEHYVIARERDYVNWHLTARASEYPRIRPLESLQKEHFLLLLSLRERVREPFAAHTFHPDPAFELDGLARAHEASFALSIGISGIRARCNRLQKRVRAFSPFSRLVVGAKRVILPDHFPSRSLSRSAVDPLVTYTSSSPSNRRNNYDSVIWMFNILTDTRARVYYVYFIHYIHYDTISFFT